MMGIEIREANAAEYGAINALAIEAWQILRDGSRRLPTRLVQRVASLVRCGSAFAPVLVKP